MLLPVLRAFLKRRNHPLQRLLIGGTAWYSRPGEDANKGCAHLPARLHPVFDELDMASAAGGVGEREVVANASAADRDAVEIRPLLQVVKVFIARDVRISREVVTCRVNAV